VSGETDLGRILEDLTVSRRDGVFVFATIPPGQPLPDLPIAAMVGEVEGTTIVLNRDVAVGAGVEYEFEAAWLTIDTHTSLEAVGVAASISTALAMKAIPVNIIAGFHHDHLLVPADMAEDAIAAVELVRQQR
jgi:uncharacterized protein